MNIGAELGQYILQTHNSKKNLNIQLGVEPPDHPFWVCQWPQGWNKCAFCYNKRCKTSSLCQVRLGQAANMHILLSSSLVLI